MTSSEVVKFVDADHEGATADSFFSPRVFWQRLARRPHDARPGCPGSQPGLSCDSRASGIARAGSAVTAEHGEASQAAPAGWRLTIPPLRSSSGVRRRLAQHRGPCCRQLFLSRRRQSLCCRQLIDLLATILPPPPLATILPPPLPLATSILPLATSILPHRASLRPLPLPLAARILPLPLPFAARILPFAYGLRPIVPRDERSH